MNSTGPWETPWKTHDQKKKGFSLYSFICWRRFQGFSIPTVSKLWETRRKIFRTNRVLRPSTDTTLWSLKMFLSYLLFGCLFVRVEGAVKGKKERINFWIQKRRSWRLDPEEADRLRFQTFGESWKEKTLRVKHSSPFGMFPGWRLTSVIVKANDDLRQEQVLHRFPPPWIYAHLPLLFSSSLSNSPILR